MEKINDKNKLKAILEIHPHLYELSIDDPYSLPFIAVEKDYRSTIEYYIEREFDPYEMINGKNIFHFAAMKGKVEILKMLFAYKNEGVVDLRDGEGRTCLDYVMENENEDGLLLLMIQPEFNVNGKDKYQKTLLHYACEKGFNEVVQQLLAKPNIQINDQDINGYTALHYASLNGFDKCVKLLSQKKSCQVNLKDKDGRTSLDIACINGYDLCARYLLQRTSCHVEEECFQLKKNVFILCEKNCAKSLEYILNHNLLDVFDLINADGKSVLHLACEKNCSEVIKLLVRQKKTRVHKK